MEVFAIFILAALGFSGTISAAKGYLNSCHNFDVHDLEGDSGRAVRMYAECKNINGDYVQTNLDLNTCFGWGKDCQFFYPDKDFSSTCNHCENAWQYEDQFGTAFSCVGYCDNKDENGKQQNSAEINLNDYIGNNNGTLHCSKDF